MRHGAHRLRRYHRVALNSVRLDARRKLFGQIAKHRCGNPPGRPARRGVVQSCARAIMRAPVKWRRRRPTPRGTRSAPRNATPLRA